MQFSSAYYYFIPLGSKYFPHYPILETLSLHLMSETKFHTHTKLRGKFPAPLCPPQIPLDQTRARTRAAAVGSQRLTA
jgi:hypothetical protein